MYEYRCKLRRIVDGDTIDVDLDLGFGVILYKQRIRMRGINTPESRTRDLEEKAAGLASKARLKQLLAMKTQFGPISVQTFKDGRCKFGRILADVYVGQNNVNDALVYEGRAPAYFGGSKKTDRWWTTKPESPDGPPAYWVAP